MTKLVLRLIINAVALYAAIRLVPGISAQDTHWLAILGLALIFGLLNAFLRPLLKMMTCPLIILTLGVFTLLINTLMFYLAGWIGTAWDIGFSVGTFWDALFGAIIVSIVSIVLSLVFHDELKGGRKKRKKRKKQS